MICYYNEWDAYAAQWLRNLILAGHLPDGDVDETDVRLVKPSDFKRRKTCHFFAGIGGWPYALKLAGWPDLPVWTASLPCQPFSVAGKQLGDLDERHLWPHFRELVDECRPPVIFGEQVASPAGREWLAGVRTDLEALGYAVGASDIPAASVGAPHIRQRLYWVADSSGNRTARGLRGSYGAAGEGKGDLPGRGAAMGRASEPTDSSAVDGLGDANGAGFTPRWPEPVGATAGSKRIEEPSASGGLGNSFEPGLEGRGLRPDGDAGQRTPWSDGSVLILCADGKTRRIKPEIFPLAARLPGDVGRLRAAGNSITAPLAAEFVAAYMQVASIGGFQCSK